ncbi:MAG TPA: hypothetical protein PK299_15065 [Anaerolineales bacterium]|nr:hypothetical protein [Anaerolineales bacterium]
MSDQATKLILCWDVLPDQSEAFFEFNQRRFVPGLRQLGIEPTEAWFTQYGDYPKFLVAGVTANAEHMFYALESGAWEELLKELLTYVRNFSQRIVPARSGFQM